MVLFTKDSLNLLRQRVDLVEVLSSHVDLKRSGASYKGLCPFHDEKTASFTVQKGDTHYHCFGCGAHGDSIGFLMSHLKMSFSDAVQNLAHRFQIPLEMAETADEKKGPNKSALKEALEASCHLFHLLLLHTKEGHIALDYLYRRGIDLDFIRNFRIGLSPKDFGILRKTMHQRSISDDIMVECGLISPRKDGGFRDFFQDRIMFPICEPSGSVIGFSGRKYKEETFGGKYINTPETPLFKKSRVLYGLNYCRRRIVKERKAIIVEGQIDTLRLILSGFNITVAAQGTAFGEEHAKELIALGINEVYLALDSDQAGHEAACKIGDYFQRQGVGALVIQLPQKYDPDLFLREYGPDSFLALMQSSVDYLTFLVSSLSEKINVDSPAGKNELVQLLIKQVQGWNHPLMVHESLRKIAHLLQVPEEMVGCGQQHVTNIFIKKRDSIGISTINPDQILESDFLRWLLCLGNFSYIEQVHTFLKVEDLHDPLCKSLYSAIIHCSMANMPCDLLSITSFLDDPNAQNLLNEILKKRINQNRLEEQFSQTIQKILDRNWMEQREEVKIRIQSAQCSDDEVLLLVKKFDELKRPPAKIQLKPVIEKA